MMKMGKFVQNARLRGHSCFEKCSKIAPNQLYKNPPCVP